MEIFMKKKGYGNGKRFSIALACGALLICLFAAPALASEAPAEAGTETVEIKPEEVNLSQTSVTLYTTTQTVTLSAAVSPTDAVYDSISWESKKPAIATVDQNGKVKAVANGSATITATATYFDEEGESHAITGECKVTVSLYSDGFHQEPDGSDWYYYKSGKEDTGTTGVISGKVDGRKGDWYVLKGKVNRAATVVKYNDVWWYFNDEGMRDASYTGFAENKNGKWYCENGKVKFDKTGVIKDETGALGSKGAWYYVVKSKVQTDYTGVANHKNEHGWWYVKNGKVDFSANTVAKNKNGWWYVVGGKVQFGFTGLANYKNANGWWYIRNGKVDFHYNGLAKNKNGWWYVKNGKVDFSYSGAAQNENGWWYVCNGKVIFDDAMTYAARFVGANTSSGQSNSDKLWSCFKAMKNYKYKRNYIQANSSTMSQLAINFFKNKGGSCYQFAAAYTCVAKVLGYEARAALGTAATHGNGIATAHGWTEVKVNGKWLMCDPEMQLYGSSSRLYMKTDATYPYRHSCSKRYTLTVSNKGASWE